MKRKSPDQIDTTPTKKGAPDSDEKNFLRYYYSLGSPGDTIRFFQKKVSLFFIEGK